MFDNESDDGNYEDIKLWLKRSKCLRGKVVKKAKYNDEDVIITGHKRHLNNIKMSMLKREENGNELLEWTSLIPDNLNNGYQDIKIIILVY